MAKHDLELPVLQNWSCHNCSGCCRQHQIEITQAEHNRIQSQNWTPAAGIPEGQPIFQTVGSFWNKRKALAHQPDGACVFLNEDGLCRIHAKFGEAAKPLACRVYPYALHPKGNTVAVSLRFSCPSVVANLGNPMKENIGEIQKIASLVVPDYATEMPPPLVNAKQKGDWPDFGRFLTALDQTLAEKDAKIGTKLCRALCWLKVVEAATFEKVQGERLGEFLELIREAAKAEFSAKLEQEEPSVPSRSGRLHFRTLIAQYARKDTATEVASGWRGRWKLLKAALRFSRGTGLVPPLQSAFQAVPFSEVDGFPPELPEESDEMFTRYFRVKVQGLHFCGPAYYEVPLVEGFSSLAMMFPVVIWLARWLALSNQQDRIRFEDISQALSIADHHHGFSPRLGTYSARYRIRQLSYLDDISRLCQHLGGNLLP